MTREKLLTLKILSHLLQFPDEDLLNSLESLHEAIMELPPGRTQEVLAAFLDYLRSQRPIRLQEEYSRHFDLSPATCLNLTYHRCGDGKDRGAAMAQLVQVYRQAGYETVAGELPDYLPLVLEFLSICPGETLAWVVQEYRSQIEALADRLNQAGAPYAHLLSVVADNFRT
jgi:nitrate reductase molybdenum cofactor assembly chaperone NarJ/NarW